MAFFKCVFQYTQPDQGWTETYYRSEGSLTDASNFQAGFLAAIQTIRSPLTQLRSIRISEVTNNRNTLPLPITPIAFPLTIPPDVASTSAIIGLNAPDIGAKRSLWMRGLDDSAVARSATTGRDTPAPFFQSALDNLLSQMTTQFLYIQALQKLTVAPMVSKSIVSVSVVTPGSVVIITEPGWALTASGRVILSNLDQKRFGGLVGAFKATELAENSFSVRYNSTLPVGVYPVTKGKTRPEEFVYGRIIGSLSGFKKFGKRDTGRNPLGGRGKRSTRIRRSA